MRLLTTVLPLVTTLLGCHETGSLPQVEDETYEPRDMYEPDEGWHLYATGNCDRWEVETVPGRTDNTLVAWRAWVRVDVPDGHQDIIVSAGSDNYLGNLFEVGDRWGAGAVWGEADTGGEPETCWGVTGDEYAVWVR